MTHKAFATRWCADNHGLAINDPFVVTVKLVPVIVPKLPRTPVAVPVLSNPLTDAMRAAVVPVFSNPLTEAVRAVTVPLFKSPSRPSA